MKLFLIGLLTLGSFSTFANELSFEYSISSNTMNPEVYALNTLDEDMACFKYALDETGMSEQCFSGDLEQTSSEASRRADLFKAVLIHSARAIFIDPTDTLIDEDLRIDAYSVENCQSDGKSTVKCEIYMDVGATFGVQSNGLDKA